MADIVRIHINREPYQSPDPITGGALYILGSIPAHERLYREVGGDKEDIFVPRDDVHIHLAKDEHFYSQKVFSWPALYASSVLRSRSARPSSSSAARAFSLRLERLFGPPAA